MVQNQVGNREKYLLSPVCESDVRYSYYQRFSASLATMAARMRLPGTVFWATVTLVSVATDIVTGWHFPAKVPNRPYHEAKMGEIATRIRRRDAVNVGSARRQSSRWSTSNDLVDDLETERTAECDPSSPRTTSTASAVSMVPMKLDDAQREFVVGYLNKHHADFLLALATAFSPLGSEMARANVWSGGSFALESARLAQIIDPIDSDSNDADWTLTLDVTVQRRGQAKPELRTVQLSASANPVPERARYYDGPAVTTAVPAIDVTQDVTMRLPIDDLIRKLCRLCAIVQYPQLSGKLIQLAFQLGGAGVGKLPENMYVHSRPMCWPRYSATASTFPSHPYVGTTGT
jgi:hypothetical protein